MAITTTYEDIELKDLLSVASAMKEGKWRSVQMMCVNTESGIDLTYTFSKDSEFKNYQIRAVQKSDAVPSLQGMFLCLFPFENEAHDLFGVNIEDMALDFDGEFYQMDINEPMTVMSPEQKEAKAKAIKIARAIAAKEAEKAAKAAEDEKGGE